MENSKLLPVYFVRVNYLLLLRNVMLHSLEDISEEVEVEEEVVDGVGLNPRTKWLNLLLILFEVLRKLDHSVTTDFDGKRNFFDDYNCIWLSSIK